MLQNTLDRIEIDFPPEANSISPDQWAIMAPEFGEALSVIVGELFSQMNLKTIKRLTVESRQQLLLPSTPDIELSQFRLYPTAGYYQKLQRSAPRPENPTGPSATGLELSLSLYRGFRTRALIHPPCLAIELSVWGAYERLQFGEMFRDHKYPVAKMLSAPFLEFETACCFANLEKAKKATAIQKLGLYYQNVEDQENQFTIRRAFSRDASVADIVQTLFPLYALYDAAMGYCQPRKSRERIYEYLVLPSKKT